MEKIDDLALSLAIDSLNILSKEKIGDPEAKLCESTIINCLNYLKGKRSHKEDNSLSMLSEKCDRFEECLNMLAGLIHDLQKNDRIHPSGLEDVEDIIFECSGMLEILREKCNGELGVDLSYFKLDPPLKGYH